MTIALLGFAALLTLSFLRVPIAFSMIIVGFIGMSWSMNLEGALANVGQTAFDAAINYELSVVPLFVLMGNFVTRARLSEELYTASNAFLGHRKGGLAMATIVACGGFSAVCGSSLATAATMSKVAMPSWSATAALTTRAAQAAPDPSPRRMPRSSSGFFPRWSRNRPAAGSALTCPATQ